MTNTNPPQGVLDDDRLAEQLGCAWRQLTAPAGGHGAISVRRRDV